MRSRMLVLAIALTGACATGIALTEGGASVQQVARSEVSPECRLVGDVSIGIPPDAGRPRTPEQLSFLMRNKAAEMAANRVVLEFSEERGSGSSRHYVGRGLAYACPNEGTSGGETVPE